MSFYIYQIYQNLSFYHQICITNHYSLPLIYSLWTHLRGDLGRLGRLGPHRNHLAGLSSHQLAMAGHRCHQ